MPLQAWWRLDETDMDNPSVAADASGNSHTGVYRGPTVGEGGNVPVAGHQDGGMRVDIPTTYPDPHDTFGHAGMASNTYDYSFAGVLPFTVDFWVKLGSTDVVQNRGLMGSFNPSFPPGEYATWGWYLNGNSTQVAFFRGDFNVISPNLDVLVTPSLTPGVWTQLRGVYDGTNMFLYQDGVLQDAMVSTVTNLFNQATNVAVGGCLLNVIFGFKTFRYPPYQTVFDDVRIWDSAVPPGRTAWLKFRGGSSQQ